MKYFSLLSLIILLAFTTACSKRSKSPDFARVDEEAIEAAFAPVNILDDDLRNRVAADIASKERLEDGRLRIRTNLRNSTKKDLNVIVRVVFKDEQGLSTGDETEWEYIYFAPQQIITHSGISRENDAANFTVEVRRP